jgi:hypothetical protein
MSFDLALLAAGWPIARDVLAFIWGVLPIPVTDALLWQFVYLPLLLAVAYPVVIQYERGGWWKLLMPFTLLAALVDVWLNFTTFSIYMASTPGKKEITFSQHLERLVFDTGWRGVVARVIARYTNKFDPTPPHIALP